MWQYGYNFGWLLSKKIVFDTFQTSTRLISADKTSDQIISLLNKINTFQVNFYHVHVTIHHLNTAINNVIYFTKIHKILPWFMDQYYYTTSNSWKLPAE